MLSIVIVGGILVVALNTVGASKMSQKKLGDASVAMLLAEDLMAEILRQPYADPDTTGEVGPGAAEAAAGDRSLFDDVDDYHGWSAGPPENRDGSLVTGGTGYTRAVTVIWVDPAAVEAASFVETGIKKITVEVTKESGANATLHAYRSEVWEDPAALQGGDHCKS